MEIPDIKKEQIKRWKSRPFSWSQFSQFRDYSQADWYSKYILGNPTPTNKRMAFGSAVGKRIETDPTYIPQLPRGVMEYGIEVMMDDIALVGYMDSYIQEEKHIHEFKTSSKDGWSQDKVDKHNQLDFYCLLLMLKENIKPENVKITLHHLVTEESGDFSIKFASPFTINSYETRRSTRDCLLLGAEIIKIRQEMEKYIIDHK